MTRVELENAVTEACRVLFPSAVLMELRAPAIAAFVWERCAPIPDQERLPL